MNDNAKMWADSLTNFQQASRKLREGEAFCCLGVACELYRRETGKGDWEVGNNGKWRFRINVCGRSVTYLPNAVVDWLGLASNSGYFKRAGVFVSLASMNDDGKSFQTIAATIKSEPEGLFVS